MTVTVFRLPHLPQYLGESFLTHYRKNDIIFREQSISDFYEIVKDDLNKLSMEGSYSKYTKSYSSPLFNDFNRRFDSIISRSKKQIEIEKSRFTLKQENLLNVIGIDAEEKFLEGNFEEAFKKTFQYGKLTTEKMITRDIDMEIQLATLQEENKDKNILAVIGTAHTLYHRLKKKGMDVKQDFAYKPFIYGIDAEMTMRLVFNKPITDDLISRSMAQTFVESYLMDQEIPEYQRTTKTRKILSKLNTDDVRDLSKYIGANYDRREMPDMATVMWLRRRGIEI